MAAKKVKRKGNRKNPTKTKQRAPSSLLTSVLLTSSSPKVVTVEVESAKENDRPIINASQENISSETLKSTVLPTCSTPVNGNESLNNINLEEIECIGSTLSTFVTHSEDEHVSQEIKEDGVSSVDPKFSIRRRSTLEEIEDIKSKIEILVSQSVLEKSFLSTTCIDKAKECVSGGIEEAIADETKEQLIVPELTYKQSTTGNEDANKEMNTQEQEQPRANCESQDPPQPKLSSKSQLFHTLKGYLGDDIFTFNNSDFEKMEAELRHFYEMKHQEKFVFAMNLLMKLLNHVFKLLSFYYNMVWNNSPVFRNLITTIGEFTLQYRGLFVTVCVLPLSFLYDRLMSLRSLVIMSLYSAPKLHHERVNAVAAQIKDWIAKGKKGHLCTARGGWESISPGYRNYKNYFNKINVNMYDILELDQEAMTITVEPLVSMGQITKYLIPKGYTLSILPEMDDLTVGGLLMGVGIETSSHVFGLFNDTVVDTELVLSDGSVVRCNKDVNKDLYDALPWSYGTLGFLTSITLKIITCKEYVKLTYYPCHNVNASLALYQKFTSGHIKDKPLFVEGIQYSFTDSVVMAGDFIDRKDIDLEQGPINPIGLWYKTWFYKHVQGMLKSSSLGVECEEMYTEYIPLRHYYHRHTKSIFWELEQIIPWGNNPLFRWALGWAVPPKVSFLKLFQTEKIRQLYETQHVIQDMLVPLDIINETLDKFHECYNLYPLWICPYKAYDYGGNSKVIEETQHNCFLRKPTTKPEDVCDDKELKYRMYVDIGAYGIPKQVLEKKPFDIVEISRKVEHYVMQNEGFQMLYADSYLSRDEFRKMFDHSHYDKMKLKYDQNKAFPQVFEKVCKAGLKKSCSSTAKKE